MKKSSNDRRNSILQEVILHNKISINELADKYNVTTETIRKDVSNLEEKKLLTKSYGFVTAKTPFVENEFTKKEQQKIKEKNIIAEHALAMIKPNSSIFLEASTTVLQLAKLLVMQSGLTIFTNSLQINEVLSNSDNQIFLTGGQYRQKSNSYVGPWVESFISQLNIDYAFIGCDGFSKTGPTIHAYQELSVKKLLKKASQQTVLLCDTSKLNNTGLYTFCQFSNLDLIIMDRKLQDEESLIFPNDLLIQ